MMPLGMASVGDVNIIKKINGRDDVRQHLAELGFVVGAEVTVVSELGGNLILNVKESRIALDKTMAMRIMV
ncbi:MAG: FeoA family protein [Eubacteriales bacterium]|nr:FeoA family protein [Eubacteriales bacterium]